MRKIINAILYGNIMTKLYYILIPVLTILAIGLVIVSFVTNTMLLFLIGIGVGILTLVFSQSFSIEEEEVVEYARDKSNRKTMKKDTLNDIVEGETTNGILTEKQEENCASAQELEKYNPKTMKKIFYKYKVKRDHRTIIIDSSQEYHIHQCPTYIWTRKGMFHMLLLEKEARHIAIPMAKLTRMRYDKGVVCKKEEEYVDMHKSPVVSAVFEACLPSYHSGQKGGRPVIYKNLYCIGSDIKVTNNSVKQILTVLSPTFVVQDYIMNSKEYNTFFKEIYKLGILCRDGAMNFQDYKNKISMILQDMSGDGMSETEFEATLQQLFEQHLISDDFIEYFIQYRKKIVLERK